MKKEYSAPIAELFEAELEGIIAVSVGKDPSFDWDSDDPNVHLPEAKSYNPIFD